MDRNKMSGPLESTDWTLGMGAATVVMGQQPYPAAALPPDGQRETDSLTEAEKERIIFECKDAVSDREVEKIIEREVPGGEISRLLDE